MEVRPWGWVFGIGDVHSIVFLEIAYRRWPYLHSAPSAGIPTVVAAVAAAVHSFSWPTGSFEVDQWLHFAAVVIQHNLAYAVAVAAAAAVADAAADVVAAVAAAVDVESVAAGGHGFVAALTLREHCHQRNLVCYKD